MVNCADARNREGPLRRGLVMKRMMGLEPTTFCMATLSSVSALATVLAGKGPLSRDF
jgi:hypothetical protein